MLSRFDGIVVQAYGKSATARQVLQTLNNEELADLLELAFEDLLGEERVIEAPLKVVDLCGSITGEEVLERLRELASFSFSAAALIALNGAIEIVKVSIQ